MTDAHLEPVDVPGPPSRPGRRRDRALLAGALVLLVAAVAFLVTVLAGRDGAPAVAPVTVPGMPAPEVDADGGITYVIPAGTWARKQAGDPVALVPDVITVKVGQRVSIRNEDAGAHIAGPFFVGPGETSTYSFSSAKQIVGDCSIHPSGRFTINVVP